MDISVPVTLIQSLYQNKNKYQTRSKKSIKKVITNKKKLGKAKTLLHPRCKPLPTSTCPLKRSYKI